MKEDFTDKLLDILPDIWFWFAVTVVGLIAIRAAWDLCMFLFGGQP